MTLPGECVGPTATICHECGTELLIGVLKSAAGYCLGFFCNECVTPYSRESGYYRTFQEAESALNIGTYGRY
jgi:hypothetical protein